MRDIRASIEVRVFMGVDNLRELHEHATVRCHCWQRGRTGRITEPTSVVVLGYRAAPVVNLAHAACAYSQITRSMPARSGQQSANYCAAPPSGHYRSKPVAPLQREPVRVRGCPA